MVEETEEGVEGSEGVGLGDVDFNVEDEYKPDPLAPKGTYHGVVTKVSYQPARSAIAVDVCLHDNGGVMNDGETPVDGLHLDWNIWLPKPGDESVMTKNGRNTKRQSKINMLKGIQEEVGIDLSTPEKIALAITEQQWVGTELDVDVSINEFNGRFRNQIDRARESSI